MAKITPVVEAWQRTEAWLKANAEEIWKSLGKGATAASIAKLEKLLGTKLPEDVRDSWRRHDGADESADLLPAVDGYEQAYSPLSVGAAAKEYRRMRNVKGRGEEEFEADRGVRAEYFNAGWVPVATNGGGDYHCIDLAPNKGGKFGQVIEWRHETNERRIVAPSWGARLKDLADGLERGRYVLDGGAGIVRAPGRVKRAATPPKSGGTPGTRTLTKDQEAMLEAARAPGPPIEDPDRGRAGQWEGLKYTQLLKAIDPKLRHFGPCRQPQRVAIERLGGGLDLPMFYENFAPRGGFAVNGVRLLSIEEVADATVALGVEKLVVMAVDDATGTRFAFDANRVDTSYRTPIVRIAPGVTPPAPRNRDPFKKDKALDAVAPDVAAHVGEFLKKLASPRHRLIG